MRFYILSDLHLGNKVAENEACTLLSKLCRDIRSTTAEGETVLFVILGDIAHRGDTLSFDIASRCLDFVCDELKDFVVKFEFVPGNHDLEKDDQNLLLFDSLTKKYGSSHSFNEKTAYSRVYENVNFIFADSTLSRDHSASGQLDIAAIQTEVKKDMSNILFCHHALTQEDKSGHDTIENAEQVYEQLNLQGISFLFHGHVHYSNAIIPKEGMVEIGCGSLSDNLDWGKSLFNQFGVGYIQDGKVICFQRFINTSDHETFASNQLYPYQASFSDPNTILKKVYSSVENYIPRKVLPYDKGTDDTIIATLLKQTRISLQEALKKHRRILLLSDAGIGKSIEIQNLAYELHDKVHTFLFPLKNYSNQDIFDLLPEQYKTLSPNRYALLFDGYDELDANSQGEFEKKLRLFNDKYVGANIVITSRTNFCRINDNRCNKFDDFKVFALDALNGSEVATYLDSLQIDSTRFFDIAKAKKVDELIYNPFYLTRLAQVFLKKCDLPQKTKLMEELVEASFEVDDKKFSGNLEDHYRNLFSRLESVAFAMQLMQKQFFNDREEFQKILASHEDRELTKKSGLLKREYENWTFIHNNFREYLAARYLSKCSRDQVISTISSNGKGIKPSWVNTLSYLTGFELDWDLLDWLSEVEPSAIVKFESDRVSFETRKKIFKQIFCKYEAMSLHFNDELCDETELANFAKSRDIIQFLMDRIENPRNMPSQYTAVNILRHYPSLMGLEDDVRASLIKCCEKYPQTQKSVCRLCLLAICQHKLATPELTTHLMSLFGDSQEDFIRLGMYEYLMENNQHDAHVQYFLDGVKYIEHKHDNNENRIGNESFELTHGLKIMSTVESISAVLEFFTEEKHLHFYSSDKVVLEVVNKAIDLYNSGSLELYDTVVNCYIKAAQIWNHTITNATIQFFLKTQTLKCAITYIADNFEDSSHKISDLINSDSRSIEYIKEAYLDGTLKHASVFHDVVERYVKDVTKYNEYAEIIKKQEGVELPEYRPIVDYDALRATAVQQYFDLLFDKDKREGLLLDLLTKIGDPNIVAGKLLKTEVRVDYHSALWYLQSAIYRYLAKDAKVADFFTDIDIEYFIICVFSEFLDSTTIPTLSLQQKQFIIQIVYKQAGAGVFKNAVKYHQNGFSPKPLVPELVDVIRFLNIALDEETLLQLTELPSFLFDSQKDNVKYEFIESKLDKNKVKKRLVQNATNHSVQDMVLGDHFDYFSANNDDALISYAINICQKTPEYSSLRMSAWRYIYDVMGAEFLSKEVIPTANAEFLIEIDGWCKDISRELMRIRMEEEYEKTPNIQLLAHMLTLGSEKALRIYVKHVRKHKKTPEKDGMNVDGPTAAIESISNPKFLPLLEKLLVCVLNKRFVDLNWKGLKSTLTRAFANCGRFNPDKAIKIIEKHRPKVTKDENGFRLCNYIIGEIIGNSRMATDVPKTIEQAQELLNVN